MNNQRRDFIFKSLITTGAAAALPFDRAFAKAAESDLDILGSDSGSIPVMQLPSDETTVQFCVLLKKKKKYHYKVIANKKEYSVGLLRREERKHSDYAVEKLICSDLELGTEYTLQIFDQTKSKPVDERYFKTFDTKKKKLRIAVAACMHDFFIFPQTNVWKSLMKQEPELILLAGDNTYADFATSGGEDGFWRRYEQTRNKLWVFKSKKLVPMLTTWDDHDTGKNNANENFKDIKLTKSIYQLFYDPEIKLDNYATTIGVGKAWSICGQNFVMFDDRTHRSANSKGSHWGQEQEDFAFDFMNQNRKPTWFVNGSQCFGAYHKEESFERDHNDHFHRVLHKLSQTENPVAFISGDMHYAELMKIEKELLGYNSYEFTTSSIHSAKDNPEKFKNKRRVNATSKHNFYVMDITADTGMLVNLKCIGNSSELLYQHEVKIQRT